MAGGVGGRNGPAQGVVGQEREHVILPQDLIVSIGKASEGDDAVAADAAQKHGAMYEAGQLSHDLATANNNSSNALKYSCSVINFQI